LSGRRRVEIVQLRFLDVVDQRPHHLAHQRVVEVITLVFERAFEFLQTVVVQIVGHAECARLLAPFEFRSSSLPRKSDASGTWPGGNLANRMLRCLRIGVCGMAAGRFTFPTPRERLTEYSA
jgi:hypothetical protein